MKPPRLAIATLASVAILGAEPAAATSCAMATDASPQAIVTGTEQLWNGERFFDLYDLAVTGLVVEIVTDETAGSPTYGATEVHLDVINAFGVDHVARELVVATPDPGWMTGYAFQLGQVYFIPLRLVGPAGEPNHSMVCDPITQLRLEDAERLPAMADSVAVATPTDAAPSPTTVPGQELTPSESGPWTVLVVAATILVAATSGLVVARRRPAR
jgi:hypothetical protein